MGLFDKLFPHQTDRKNVEGFFKTLTTYMPAFTSWQGGLYESELVRSAINARATHISKLKMECYGTAQPSLRAQLKVGPNEFQTWGQFLYRTSTILDTQNNCFIVPIVNRYGETTGVYPVLPSRCEILQYQGEPYLKYEFRDGQTATLPLAECGILNKFQYRDDFFGENNDALRATMELVNIQNQGIEEGVKNSNTYRFMAQMSNFSKAEDLTKERKRFSAENFSGDSGGGLLLFPNTYSNIEQIKSTPFVADVEQMQLITHNVFNYFGVNEEILQNKVVGDAWSAFYEGAIEPFAVQLSDVMTKMLFTRREIVQGSGIMATANRLQYMSNKEKLEMSTQLTDRGLMNRDEVREIWNLPPLPNGEGQAYIVRGEYKNADAQINNNGKENTNDE